MDGSEFVTNYGGKVVLARPGCSKERNHPHDRTPARTEPGNWCRSFVENPIAR